MKFRAKTADFPSMQAFCKLLATTAHLTKTCVLRITQEKMHFLVVGRLLVDGVSLWCELVMADFFEEISMLGLAPDANEILLEVITEQLWRPLQRSCARARSLKMKLTRRRNLPCITFELEFPVANCDTCRLVTHDIPVRVLPQRLWDDFRAPLEPEFDVSIYLPSLKTLRSVVEKMKNLSNYVTVWADGSGQLRLRVRTDLVTITTYFCDLGRPSWRVEDSSSSGLAAAAQPPNVDPTTSASANVDIRKLHQLLSSFNVAPNRVVCNIVRDRVLQFFVLFDHVQLQYFLPAMTL